MESTVKGITYNVCHVIECFTFGEPYNEADDQSHDQCNEEAVQSVKQVGNLKQGVRAGAGGETHRTKVSAGGRGGGAAFSKIHTGKENKDLFLMHPGKTNSQLCYTPVK